MPWDIYYSAEAEEWILGLDDAEYAAIMSSIVLLETKGPALGEPAVKRIVTSKFHNMKELRSFGGNLRALFAFDPERNALILLGGDKTGNWDRWYEDNVDRADEMYADYLAYLKTKEK